MSTETKTAAELAAEVKANFDRKFDELKATSEEFLGKLEASDRVTEGLKQKADEALTEATEAKARLDEVEQKMVQFGERGSQDDRPKSAGYQFIENEEVKSFLANPSAGKRVSVEVKAIISSLTTDADGSAGDVLVPMRAPMVQPVNRRLTIRDLLTPGRTNTSSIQYPKESGFTNSAATVTETAGTAKAQSELKFDIVTTSVTTIAHWVLATRQNGIYTQATASTANLAVVTAPTFLDVLRAAMLQASLANIPPTGIVLNPTDWFKIETTKDTAGAYIIGNPQDGTNPRLWGLPVVETPAMTVDKFLVGAFRYGAQIFDRQDATVEISTEDSDNFRKNLVTILAEERLALAVYNTLAFVKGDFSDQVTDLTS
jgi:hypothetical protein